MKSGIRIENAKALHQQITNTVVHGCLGWSFSVQYSSNVFVQDSYFINSFQIGVAVFGSQNVTLDRIVVGDTATRPASVGHGLRDKESCVSICSFLGPDSACKDVKVSNSIAGGCIESGFVVPGHDCGESDS